MSAVDASSSASVVALIVPQECGESHYRKLAGSRLRGVRRIAGISPGELASLLSDVYGPVTARQVETWESGAERVPAGIILAALDATHVRAAELLGIEPRDAEDIADMESQIARIRRLLNDPLLLAKRLYDLLNGSAPGLHPV